MEFSKKKKQSKQRPMGVCKLDPLKCTSICYGFCDFDINGIGENSLPFSVFNSMHT